MKNKAIIFLLTLGLASCLPPSPQSRKQTPEIVVGVLADRSLSLLGYLLLDTAVLRVHAEILVASGRAASLYFDVAGNPDPGAEPEVLELPGLPALSANPTMFERSDSVSAHRAYRAKMQPIVDDFLQRCQNLLDATANQQWTDLKAASDRLSVVFNLPVHDGCRKVLFEQSDGLHHLPRESPELYCHPWPDDVKVFTAGRAPGNRCDSTQELGSVRQFSQHLYEHLK